MIRARSCVAVLALLALAACERERRDFEQPPSAAKVARLPLMEPI